MKQFHLFVFTVIVILGACGSSKKNVSAPAAPATTAPASEPLILAKPAGGVYAPGKDELMAIQKQFPDVTMEKLKEGHFLYTQGACVKCHGSANITLFTEPQWKNIMDDMAVKARITDEQKDAVYKYVLSIKAAQQQ